LTRTNFEFIELKDHSIWRIDHDELYDEYIGFHTYENGCRKNFYLEYPDIEGPTQPIFDIPAPKYFTVAECLIYENRCELLEALVASRKRNDKTMEILEKRWSLKKDALQWFANHIYKYKWP
jgi:hypothetical protein